MCSIGGIIREWRNSYYYDLEIKKSTVYHYLPQRLIQPNSSVQVGAAHVCVRGISLDCQVFHTPDQTAGLECCVVKDEQLKCLGTCIDTLWNFCHVYRSISHFLMTL